MSRLIRILLGLALAGPVYAQTMKPPMYVRDSSPRTLAALAMLYQQTVCSVTANTCATTSTTPTFTTVTVGTVSTAGRAICSIDDVMAGASATDNALNCTGTVAASLSAEQRMVMFSLTGNSQAQVQQALWASLSGAASTTASHTIFAQNSSNSGNVAPYTDAVTAGFFENTGVGAGNAGYSFGVVGRSNAGATTMTGQVGVLAQANNLSNLTTGFRAGLLASGFNAGTGPYFGALILAEASNQTPAAPATSAALAVSNKTNAIDILDLYDNTLLVAGQIDGGQWNYGNNIVSDAADASKSFIAGTKTLTETTDTNFLQISVPSGTVASGEVELSVRADDGTDFQVGIVRLSWKAINKGGTLTCPNPTETTAFATTVSAGTLTEGAAFKCTTGTNLVNLSANITSSLTQTTLRAKYLAWKLEGTGNMSPQ